jgi:hypothetical protein
LQSPRPKETSLEIAPKMRHEPMCSEASNLNRLERAFTGRRMPKQDRSLIGQSRSVPRPLE